jgi:large subunit ribosomal protein L18
MSLRNKKLNKNRRHVRVRAKVSGTAMRPRIAIFRSNRFTYAQVIDDAIGKTIISISDHQSKTEKTNKTAKIKKTENAATTGKKLALAMKEKGITKAVLDRGGFKYHGRVKALADSLRENGIKI